VLDFRNRLIAQMVKWTVTHLGRSSDEHPWFFSNSLCENGGSGSEDRHNIFKSPSFSFFSFLTM
jgi:hypothetical protein